MVKSLKGLMMESSLSRLKALFYKGKPYTLEELYDKGFDNPKALLGLLSIEGLKVKKTKIDGNIYYYIKGVKWR